MGGNYHCLETHHLFLVFLPSVLLTVHDAHLEMNELTLQYPDKNNVTWESGE